MLDRNPYFVIGEKIKIVSPVYPKLTGYYYVDHIKYLPGSHNERKGYYYFTTQTNLYHHESELRKVYDTCDKQFDVMISELKGNIIK